MTYGRGYKPKPVVEPAEPAEDYTAAGLDSDFGDVVARARKLSEKKAAIESALSDLKLYAKALLETAGKKSVLVAGGPVTLAKGKTTKTLNAVKLLNHVSARVIEQCTDVKEGEPYVLWGKAK